MSSSRYLLTSKVTVKVDQYIHVPQVGKHMHSDQPTYIQIHPVYIYFLIMYIFSFRYTLLRQKYTLITLNSTSALKMGSI